MQFGAFWKNKDGDGFNGRLVLDADVTLRQDVGYDMFLNPVDKKGNDKAPDYRLELRHIFKN